MADFPRSLLGRQFSDQAALVTELRKRGQDRVTDHPGQHSPAEPLKACSQDDKRVIGEAAAVLIADATHPDVLMMLSEVGLWAQDAWIPALLDRLESGPPLPDAPSYATEPVAQRLTATLARPRLPEALQSRIRQVLEDHGPAVGLVQFLVVNGDGPTLATAIEDYLDEGDADVSMLVFAIGRLSRKDPAQVLMLVPSLQAVDKDGCARIADQVQAIAEDWYKTNGDRLRKSLGL